MAIDLEARRRMMALNEALAPVIWPPMVTPADPYAFDDDEDEDED